MDDRELERLFGNDSDSDKGTLGKEDRVPEGRSEKKDPESGRQEKHRPVKNAPAKKESGKKPPEKKAPEKKEPDKQDPGKKAPEKKVPEKKDPEKKEPVKKESEKKDTEHGKSGKEDPEKEITGKEDPEDKPAEDKKDGKEPEENGEKEPSPDEAAGDEKDKPEEESAEESGEDDPEEEKEDSDESGKDGEDAGDKEKATDKEEKGNGKEAAPENVRKRRPRPEPEPADGLKNIAEMIPLSGKSILAICLAFAVVLMVVLVMFLPAFRVRNTSVEGNVVLTDQEILKAVGLEYDAHLMSGVSGNIIDILRLDYGKTEQRIKEQNPYVEDIRITIKLPSTVDIKVRERSKVCYIRTPDGYAALDRDGIVLELSSFDSGRTVRPVICGLNVKYAEMGKPVKIENMNDYKKSIIVLGAILAADNASVGGNYSMFENTSEVRILPSGYIFLTIYSPSGNLIQIKLNGTESIGDKMAWLLYVFNGEAFDKITVDGALDMTGEEYIFGEYD